MAGTSGKRRCAGVHKLAGIVGGVLVMALALLAPAAPVHAAIACTVNSTMDPSDPGNLTLRNAVGALNDGACASDSITFDPNIFPVGGAQKITLDSASGSLTLVFTTRPVTIDGAGAGVVVDGNDAVRVIRVSTGVTATLGALTIQHGKVTSANGGGVINSGALTVTNSTFSANSASGGGGGIANSNFKSMTVTNSTFSGNSAGAGGGGIFTGGGATLTNVIVANSPSGGDLSAFATSGGAFTGSNNLIDDAASAGGFVDGAGGNIIGHPALLGSLGDYGGPTQTFPLLPGSPAIDAGATVGSGPAGATVPVTDQRGRLRLGAPDIGSFESQGFTLAVTGGDNQSAVINTAFANPLALTVAATNPVEPVAGGAVIFTAPASGPSATIAGSPATIGAGGQASATATANGVKGSYSVGARVGGTVGATFHLVNTAPLVSIAVTPNPVVLKVGQQQQFTATGTYVDNSTADLTDQVTWSPAAGTVARVDASGKVTGMSPGSATITATQGGVSGQATVTVSTPVLTGVQPAPAPQSRPSGVSTGGTATPAPAPVPGGPPAGNGGAPAAAPTGR